MTSGGGTLTGNSEEKWLVLEWGLLTARTNQGVQPQVSVASVRLVQTWLRCSQPPDDLSAGTSGHVCGRRVLL